MTVALRYIGRKPRGQRNLFHPVEAKPYQFFTSRALPATQVDEKWADDLLSMKDKEGRPLFLMEMPAELPAVETPKLIRCKRCDAEFHNMGDFLAHTRKEHKTR